MMVKLVSIQSHPSYHSFNLKDTYIELFYAIIPTLFPSFLLIYYPYISLHF